MRDEIPKAFVLACLLLFQPTITFGQRIFKDPNAPNNPQTVRFVEFSPDGQMIASADIDGDVKLWTIRGKLIGKLKGKDVCFSPNGKTLIVRTDKELYLWDVKTKEKRDLPVKGEQILSMSASVKQPIVAVIVEKANVRETQIWDIETAKKINSFSCPATGAIGFSPDGSSFAVSGYDAKTKTREIQIWNISKGTKEAAWKVSPHRSAGRSLDGKLLATMDMEGLEIWDAANGKMIDTFKWKEKYGRKYLQWFGNVYHDHLVFSPDSRIVACIARFREDTVVKNVFHEYHAIVLWDVATGLIIDILEGPPRRERQLTCIAYNPSGRTVIAGCSDGTLLHWYVGGK